MIISSMTATAATQHMSHTLTGIIKQSQLPGFIEAEAYADIKINYDFVATSCTDLATVAWLGATHEWSARDSLVSLYIPRDDGNMAVLRLDGVHIAMSSEEYLELEAGFLGAVAATDVAPVLAELRALYGDL